MENIVMITLLTLTLFGKIEMHTFEIPNTREDYNGRDGINWHDSNAIVCSSWYNRNVVITVRKNPKPGQNHYKHRWNGKKVIGYICGGHEPQ
jgi:hypothetical protein|tara:strand:+ start:2582 stop:2857 length:276 start_codon:yes stop_codon:yes gene_type:complete